MQTAEAAAYPCLFLSTPSVGRATPPAGFARPALLYFYPRPPWGGRLAPDAIASSDARISIHALRGEGDPGGQAQRKSRKISIHALRGEGDPRPPQVTATSIIFLSTPSVGRATQESHKPQNTPLFLSTPSVGRATCRLCKHRRQPADFYPRPPWGGRPDVPDDVYRRHEFLSTPSVGRATRPVSASNLASVFLSTPSVGRATKLDLLYPMYTLDFYPRPPWGGRRGY